MPDALYFDQREFDIRCEWAVSGAAGLAPTSSAVIIVDVLSFSTSVDIAVSQGAAVFPYRRYDERAGDFAASVGAELATQGRSASQRSLSPCSLLHLQPGARLVLPSLNGANLALAAGSVPVLAGCLRNARAVAAAALRFGPRIAVIPAGERWQSDGSLRPAFEDWVGAGAIISFLSGSLSPEAAMAAAAFQAAQPRLGELLAQCSSGKELIQRGYAEDVELAARLNASDCAPVLVDGAFVASMPDHDQVRD